MPLALLVVGLMLIAAGARGKVPQLFSLLKDDSKGFFVYAVVVSLVAMAGYIPKVRPVSNAFLLLVIVVLVIGSGKQFFSQFSSTLNQVKS